MKTACKENGNHQDGERIIDHGNRHYEGSHRFRQPAASNCENTEGKGDVCRHRHTPTARRRLARVDQRIDDYRNCHATDGGKNRNYRLPWFAQDSVSDFVTKFDSDAQKEYENRNTLEGFDVRDNRIALANR